MISNISLFTSTLVCIGLQQLLTNQTVPELRLDSYVLLRNLICPCWWWKTRSSTGHENTGWGNIKLINVCYKSGLQKRQTCPTLLFWQDQINSLKKFNYSRNNMEIAKIGWWEKPSSEWQWGNAAVITRWLTGPKYHSSSPNNCSQSVCSNKAHANYAFSSKVRFISR